MPRWTDLQVWIQIHVKCFDPPLLSKSIADVSFIAAFSASDCLPVALSCAVLSCIVLSEHPECSCQGGLHALLQSSEPCK